AHIRHQRGQIRPETVGANARWNLDPSAMTAVRTMTAVRQMFHDQGGRQRRLGRLVPGRFGIIVLRGLGQRSLASLADGWPVMHHLLDAIGRKASAGMTRMSRLSARLAPGRRFAGTLGRLRWIARRRTRGVRRVLPELGFEVPNTLL
ncbi:MAG TPA: hypothetical protein VJK02_02765, partial [Anaerolineales bacterium]|nr:hypothetical protein [Anaerolineales bacterium]